MTEKSKEKKAPKESINRLRSFLVRMGTVAGLTEPEMSMLFVAPTEDIPEIGHRWLDMQEDADRNLDLMVEHWKEQYMAQKGKKPDRAEVLAKYDEFDRARISKMRRDLRQVMFDTIASLKNNVFVTAQDRADFSQPVTHEEIPLPAPFPDDDEYIRLITEGRKLEDMMIPRQWKEEGIDE